MPQLLKWGAQYFQDRHLKSRLGEAARTPQTICKGDWECGSSAPTQCAPPAEQGL